MRIDRSRGARLTSQSTDANIGAAPHSIYARAHTFGRALSRRRTAAFSAAEQPRVGPDSHSHSLAHSSSRPPAAARAHAGAHTYRIPSNWLLSVCLSPRALGKHAGARASFIARSAASAAPAAPAHTLSLHARPFPDKASRTAAAARKSFVVVVVLSLSLSFSLSLSLSLSRKQ